MGRRLAMVCAWLTMVLPAMADTGKDFALPGLDGQQVTLSDYRGKWVVVNYWATWCGPCREELPELNAFHRAHKDTDAVVLGINFEETDTATIERFLESYPVEFPIALQAPVDETALGPVPGMPTTYIVSPQGEIKAWQIGGMTQALLEKFLATQQGDAGL